MSATVESDETHAGAQHFCAVMRELGVVGPEPRVLVAGCGKGHEALFIRQELGGSLVGIDIGEEWDPALGADLPDFELKYGSILDMPFPDDSFDLVFYHHVIEHVSDPDGSLRELARVLRPGGVIYVGTPNRHRAVGYVGSYDTTLRDKLRWNLADYRARLTGKFRNEHGAHAGFAQNELNGLLTKYFADIDWITPSYLHFKYGERLPAPVLRALSTRPVREFVAPAIYAVARGR